MRTDRLPLLLLAIGLSLSACDSKKDDAAKTADKKAETKSGADSKADAKADDVAVADDAAKADDEPAADDGEPAAEGDGAAEPEAAAAPKLEPMTIDAWKVTLQVPAGAKAGEIEDGEGIGADTLDIDADEACGVEIELYRHEKSATGVEEMFKNATGPSGNKDDQFPIQEKTDDGYKVKHSWVIPLGDTMWAVEVGKVLGDHLYLCGSGSLMGVEKEAAECALAACETLALAEG